MSSRSDSQKYRGPDLESDQTIKLHLKIFTQRCCITENSSKIKYAILSEKVPKMSLCDVTEGRFETINLSPEYYRRAPQAAWDSNKCLTSAHKMNM